MTIVITILLALAVIYLDYKAYRRILAKAARKSIKYTFIAIVAISYFVVLLTPIFMYLIIDEDNCSYMMKISMIFLTIYLLLSIPRLIFYIFWLPTRKRCWMWTGTALSSIVFITFLYSVFVTRTDYQVKHVEISYSDLPDSFNGYKLVFISDIHTGSMIDPCGEISDVVSIINNLDADAVFFGGDIVNIHHSELSSPVLCELSRLKARDGIFMVLGNHDTGAYVKGSDKVQREVNTAVLVTKMESAGWTVLRDSTEYICRGNDSISITGIDYNEKLLKYKHSIDAIKGVELDAIYKNVPDSVFNITISHLPQLWHALCDGGYSDLTLSGHIHAMQFKIAGLSPAALMYDEWSGLYMREEGKLYINDGIGCVGYLARIGARPEITVIELKCE